MVRFYGEREADRIIHAAQRRKKKLKSKIEEQKKETLATPLVKRHIEDNELIAYGLREYIAEKYGEVINKYNFPLSLIEGACSDKIFYNKQ